MRLSQNQHHISPPHIPYDKYYYIRMRIISKASGRSFHVSLDSHDSASLLTLQIGKMAILLDIFTLEFHAFENIKKQTP